MKYLTAILLLMGFIATAQTTPEILTGQSSN